MAAVKRPCAGRQYARAEHCGHHRLRFQGGRTGQLTTIRLCVVPATATARAQPRTDLGCLSSQRSPRTVAAHTPRQCALSASAASGRIPCSPASRSSSVSAWGTPPVTSRQAAVKSLFRDPAGQLLNQQSRLVDTQRVELDHTLPGSSQGSAERALWPTRPDVSALVSPGGWETITAREASPAWRSSRSSQCTVDQSQ